MKTPHNRALPLPLLLSFSFTTEILISRLLSIMATFRRGTPAACRLLDSMIDEVAEDKAHLLTSLMEIVRVLIEKYEDEHVPSLAVE